MRPVLASVLAWWLLAPSASARAEAPPRDPEALQRSLDMLRLEMKLSVLQTLYEQAGYYVPAPWPKRYQDEHQKLAAELDAASRLRVAGLDSWLVESQKTRKNEVLEMYKLAESAITTIWKDDKAKATAQLAALKTEEPRQGRKKNALEVARFMEGILKKRSLANKGSAADTEALLWWRSARNLYRGAIQETDDLITGIVAFDKQRREVESRLVLLGEIETGLQIAKDVQAPLDKLMSVVEEKALAKLQEWLKSNYTDVDEGAVKAVWGTLKSDLGKARDLYTKVNQLDADITLKGNPTALAAAKRFAILGALYNYTLGKVKDLPGMKALGPLCDFLDYYGKALNLVPDIAQKVQALVQNIEQRHKGIRALDAWNLKEFKPGQLQQLEVLEPFGLQVATDTEIDMTAPQARFYMLVPKEVVPRGYATLSLDQFQRLTQALADERFLNASAEAWRGPAAWVSENMFEWRNSNPLSATVSSAYLEDLRGKSRKTPFTPGNLLDLAQGRPIAFKGAQWTADRLRSRAEIAMDILAEEMAVRKAVVKYHYSMQEKWTAYKAILTRHGVAFTPQQILNLFNFYQNSQGNEAHLEAYLREQGQGRSDRARGLARMGIPLVKLKAASTASGAAVTIVADFIVSDLAPAGSVKAEVIWKVSGWAAPETARESVVLVNGIKTLTHKGRALAALNKKRYPVTVEVKWQAGSAEQTARFTGDLPIEIEAGVTGGFVKGDSDFLKLYFPSEKRVYPEEISASVALKASGTITARLETPSNGRRGNELDVNVLWSIVTFPDPDRARKYRGGKAKQWKQAVDVWIMNQPFHKGKLLANRAENTEQDAFSLFSYVQRATVSESNSLTLYRDVFAIELSVRKYGTQGGRFNTEKPLNDDFLPMRDKILKQSKALIDQRFPP